MSSRINKGMKIVESKKQLAYLYALSQIRGLGPVKVKTLLSRFPDLCEIFYLDVDTLMSIKGVSRELALQIKVQAEHLEEAEVLALPETVLLVQTFPCRMRVSRKF